jgi:hypothetical protein
MEDSSTTMALQKSPAKEHLPTLYELRHLRGTLSRLEAIGETRSPTIADLRRIVATRIFELEAALGSIELLDA